MNIMNPKKLEGCEDPDENCDNAFDQPGLFSGHGKFKKRDKKTCPNMRIRIRGDNPSITNSTFEEKCPPRTSKIAVIVDENEDFHFLRQDSNRFWSQKPGGRRVINKDAGGHVIWNPQLCESDWKRYDPESDLNYDIFCGYMCVPRDRPLYIQG
jgi:hypothetical protein